jgi:hypothetical protein
VGVNLPLFTLCRQDHLSGVHFDVKHLNILTWEEGKLDTLEELLEARIVAVLDWGPITPSKG